MSGDHNMNCSANQALDKMADNARALGLDYEPAQQEPVAVYVGETWCGSVVRLYEDLPLETSLYTSPQPSKPLTDEQIKTMWRCSKIYGTNEEKALALARAIEAAHQIGVNK